MSTPYYVDNIIWRGVFLNDYHKEFIKNIFDKKLENNKKLDELEIKNIISMLESTDKDSLMLGLDLLVKSNIESIIKISNLQNKENNNLVKMSHMDTYTFVPSNDVKIFIDIYDIVSKLYINKKFQAAQYHTYTSAFAKKINYK